MRAILGLRQGDTECLYNLSATCIFSNVNTVTEHMLCWICWLEENKLNPYTKDILPLLDGRTIIEVNTKEWRCHQELNKEGRANEDGLCLLPHNSATSGLQNRLQWMCSPMILQPHLPRESLVLWFHSFCRGQLCSGVQPLGVTSYYLFEVLFLNICWNENHTTPGKSHNHHKSHVSDSCDSNCLKSFISILY